MRLRISIMLVSAIMVSIAVSSCKTKRGAGSANVRTLSLKTPGSYMLWLGNKNMAETTSITTKELAAADKMKIMSQGKEAQNVTVKFKVKLVRADADAGSAENDGTELSSGVRDLLKSAEAGDKISFESIRIIPQGGEALSYTPLTYDVK